MISRRLIIAELNIVAAIVLAVRPTDVVAVNLSLAFPGASWSL